jgi:hypothetical protein
MWGVYEACQQAPTKTCYFCLKLLPIFIQQASQSAREHNRLIQKRSQSREFPRTLKYTVQPCVTRHGIPRCTSPFFIVVTSRNTCMLSSEIQIHHTISKQSWAGKGKPQAVDYSMII